MAIDVNIPSQVKTYANLAAFPATGTLKTIFIATDTNKTYRWTGSAYVEISATAASTWGAIGGTLSNQTDLQNALNTKEPTITAGTTSQYYRGDKTFQTLDNNAVGLSNVDNTSDANKPVSTATQTALNAKVTGNTAITGATKTKVTYDSKGLVTAGADATTADIADSLNKRYVTDANLTVIGNTSGTNTGDQTLVGLGGVPTTRTLTINGTTQDLSADRTFTISTGITIGTTAITSGTNGRFLFDDAGVVSETNGAFWDKVNGRWGIGTTTPAKKLEVLTTGLADNSIEGIRISVTHNSSQAQAALEFRHTNFDALCRISTTVGSGGADPSMSFYIRSVRAMNIFQTGNIGIGTTTDAGFKLDVNGTARVSSTLGVGGALVSGGSGFGNTMLSITSTYPCFILNSTGGTASKVGFNLDASKLYFSEETNNAADWGHRIMANTKVGGLVILNNTAAGSTAVLNASAVLQADSTTRGFLPPRMTTTQKNAIASPATGLQIYDSTLNRPCFYDGTTWITL